MTTDWSSPFDRLEALLPTVGGEQLDHAIRLAVVAGREAARQRDEMEMENVSLRGALRKPIAKNAERNTGGLIVSEEQRKQPSNLTEWLAESPHARRVILSIPTRPDANDIEAPWRHDPKLLQFDFRSKLPNGRIASVCVVMQDDYLHNMENAEDLIRFAKLSLDRALGESQPEGDQ